MPPKRPQERPKKETDKYAACEHNLDEESAVMN